MTGLGVQEPRAMIQQRMCAPYAIACGHQALGTASRSDAYLLFEMPLPWPATLYQSNADFRTLREMRARLWESGFRVGVVALAPDPAYSEAGFIRMVYLRRPGGAFDRFVREEYRVPAEMGAVPLARALLGVPGRNPEATFERYRVDMPQVRDLLVCTHGSVDACCGRLGFPFYRALRHDIAPAAGDGVRIWRASHFGGHRFAPTVLDLPEGRLWAHLDTDAAEQILLRTGSPGSLRRHYRGWAGVDTPFEQFAEGEAFFREGWRWIDERKTATVLHLNEDGRRAVVRIDFTAPDGRRRGAYEATVAVCGVTPLVPCGRTPEEAQHEASKYQVTEIRHVADERIDRGRVSVQGPRLGPSA